MRSSIFLMRCLFTWKKFKLKWFTVGRNLKMMTKWSLKNHEYLSFCGRVYRLWEAAKKVRFLKARIIIRSHILIQSHAFNCLSYPIKSVFNCNEYVFNTIKKLLYNAPRMRSSFLNLQINPYMLYWKSTEKPIYI